MTFAVLEILSLLTKVVEVVHEGVPHFLRDISESGARINECFLNLVHASQMVIIHGYTRQLKHVA